MISFGNDSIKKEAFSLWSETFRDTNDYINYYFNSRYKHENFLCYLKNNSLSCGVHFNPYEITYLNRNFSSRFLVGAATFPQYKDKGYFNSILNYSFSYFLSKSTDIIFLIPANSSLYSKYNFALSHFLMEYHVPFSELTQFKIDKNIEIKKVTHENISEYGSFIFKESRIFSSYINKNLENFNLYIEECEIEGGHTYVVIDNNIIQGAFSYYISNDTIVVKHIYFKNGNSFLNILGFINNFSNYYKKVQFITSCNSQLEYFFPNLKKVSIIKKPFLMTRILNAKKILETFFSAINPNLFLQKDFFVNLIDKDILENNFILIVSEKNEDLFFSYSSSQFSEENSTTSGITINISNLTSLLFGAISPILLIKKEEITLHNIEEEFLTKIFNVDAGFIHEEV